MSIVTVTASFLIARRDIELAAKREKKEQEFTPDHLANELAGSMMTSGPIAPVDTVTLPSRHTTIARVAAIIVPFSYLLVVVTLIAFRIRGGEATTIIGGVTLLLASVFTLLSHGADSFDLITEHLIKGFSFGM